LKDRPRIGWMGSENHFCHPITEEYKSGIRGGDFGVKLMDFIRGTVDKYQWVLSGAKPMELIDLVESKKIEYHGWKSVLEFPAHAKSLDLDIGIAPLFPCPFNDGKSRIKALEFAALGIPAVYAGARPYREMSLSTDDEDLFIAHIEKLATDIDYRTEIYRKDYAEVYDELYWEDRERLNLRRYIQSYMSLFGKALSI
jgi:hypothetical protein